MWIFLWISSTDGRSGEHPASNVPLQERLNDLLELAENREFYLEETDSINAKIDEYTAEFPSDIRSEDGIVLSKNMEESLDMSISNVGLGTRSLSQLWTEAQKIH